MGEQFSVRMFCGAVYGCFKEHMKNIVKLFLSYFMLWLLWNFIVSNVYARTYN